MTTPTEGLKRDIRAFVVHNFLFGDDPGFADSSSFLEEAIIDSMGVLELVAYLDRQHGIQVADEELKPSNLDSIDAIAAFVERKRNGGA
jgi:acyl carrier protein